MSSQTTVLRFAPFVTTVTDYGSHLETRRGIVWLSPSGYPIQGAYERNVTPAMVRDRFVDAPASITFEEHAPIVNSFDMNPHGLM